MLIKATLMLILTIALNLYVLLLQLSFLSSPVHQFTSQFTNSQFASSRQFASSPVRKSPVNQFTRSLVHQFIKYTIWLFHLVTHCPVRQSTVQHFTLHEFAIRELSPVRQFASSPVRQKIKNSKSNRETNRVNKQMNKHTYTHTDNKQAEWQALLRKNKKSRNIFSRPFGHWKSLITKSFLLPSAFQRCVVQPVTPRNHGDPMGAR